MEVNCEGCAGCCLDWRGLLANDDTAARDGIDGYGHRQRDPFENADSNESARESLDDDPSFVPLTRDEVRAFLEAGMAAALTPRFWHAREEREDPRSLDTSSREAPREGIEIDGHTVAAIAGRPVFFIGLRKPPKPVAPFGRAEPTWLPACVFLDPTTLQCRIHDDDLFPDECGAYPEHNLALAQDTECERVEAAFGGDRLLEADHDEPDDLLLGSQAIGAKLFCHPWPSDLEGIVARAAADDLTREDRAETMAVAAASSPGTLALSEYHYERAKARALEDADADTESATDSWVGPAIRDWYERCRGAGEAVPSPTVADALEVERGAPETPGWSGRE